MRLLSWVPFSLWSLCYFLCDTFCLLEVPPFQPSSQKTGPLVSPLCYVFPLGAFVSGAKFYWKTEKNATDIWPMILGPLLLWLKRMIFLPQNFRYLQWLLSPTMRLPGGWDWREWKIIVNFPPLWPLKESEKKKPFLILGPEREIFSWHSFCLHSVALPAFVLLFESRPVDYRGIWKNKSQVILEGKLQEMSLMLWWYLGFWSSSPVLLLPFTFQSFHMAAQCIVCKVYSWI